MRDTKASPLWQLLRYVRPHRRDAVLTAVFGVAGFLLSFAYPWIIGSVVDVVVAPASASMASTLPARQTALVHYTELAAATALGHAVIVYGRGHFNVRLGDGVVTDVRRALFDHIQRLSVQFFTKERTGAILARVIHDVHEATTLIYQGLLVAGMDAVQLVIAVALLASISWKLTLACVAIFPMYGLVFALMNPRVRRASEKMHVHMSLVSANVTEQLSGQALIKTHTAEPRESARFGAEAEHHHRLVVAQSHAGHMVASCGEVLVHFGTTLVVGYGGWLALRGEMSVGTMTRFLGYVLIMFGPVRRFAELNITYQSSLSAMRRVFRVLAIQPAIVEPAHPHALPPTRGEVRFEDVRFRYEEGHERLEDETESTSGTTAIPRATTRAWVLDGITLEARPGERVAVVGPSGAGKTTLVSLVPRLYDVTAGRILVDGVDVRDYSLPTLRSAIGVVQQDSFLFTGSIRDNIAYGRPDATDEEIVEAAVAAHAHEFVARLPDGYATVLGERGVNLSGGQRQRLSIARALLKDPRLLVLDEATSALDTESESVVQHALERAMRGRTCFIVAHRLSTIRNADRIFVLERGTVVEVGTHRELLSSGGVYARLVRRQTGTS
jgi:subfamily B ATP-binding cassette protein MsbA